MDILREPSSMEQFLDWFKFEPSAGTVVGQRAMLFIELFREVYPDKDMAILLYETFTEPSQKIAVILARSPVPLMVDSEMQVKFLPCNKNMVTDNTTLKRLAKDKYYITQWLSLNGIHKALQDKIVNQRLEEMSQPRKRLPMTPQDCYPAVQPLPPSVPFWNDPLIKAAEDAHIKMQQDLGIFMHYQQGVDKYGYPELEMERLWQNGPPPGFKTFPNHWPAKRKTLPPFIQSPNNNHGTDNQEVPGQAPGEGQRGRAIILQQSGGIIATGSRPTGHRASVDDGQAAARTVKGHISFKH